MRRTIAVGISLVFALGLVGALPAGATHCNAGNITTCDNPLTIVVTEGVGNVCSKANVKNPIAYGTKCTYVSDPIWAQTKAVSSWNQAGYADGSKYQGLFWPGVGPGAIGPYRLNISSAVNPPNNVCVDSIGGNGCKADVEGKLTRGEPLQDGQETVGAYCGSSEGRGVYKFTSSDNSAIDEGTLGWDQSAATILPVYGEVTKHNGVNLPAGARPTVRGFTSSRGIGGSGNCGLGAPGQGAPTTGFQTEGFLITY